MNVYAKLVLVFYLLFSCISSIYAYELGTHARLAEQAYNRSVLATQPVILENLSLSDLDLFNPLGTVRTKYADAFSGAKGSLASIVDQLGVLVGGRLGENWAYYTVVRNEGGQDMGFPLFIIRGNDGVWRIGEM